MTESERWEGILIHIFQIIMVLLCILSQVIPEVIFKPTEVDINIQVGILEIEPPIQAEVANTIGPQETTIDLYAKCMGKMVT